MAQLNPVIGDTAGTAARLIEAARQARAQGADVMLTSELVLPGYPPRDLLLRRGVVERCEQAIEEIAARIDPELTLVIGHPRRAAAGLMRPLHNSVSVLRGGAIQQQYDKRLLPGYDVFDEDRYFQPGLESCVIEVRGRRLGLLACEDLWQAGDVQLYCRYPASPTDDLAEQRCDAVLALNASPFVMGKWQRHVQQTCEAARRIGAPIIAVNQVGGNDDLVFDGRSVVVDAAGRLVHRMAGWVEAMDVIDLDDLPGPISLDVDPMAELFDALVLGVRDYVHKTQHRGVAIGLSGGIDSALVAVIAAAALGPEHVHGWIMPSRYSAQASRDDALALCAKLGIAHVVEAPIHGLHEAVRVTLAEPLGEKREGLTDENVQARLRGLLLMAASNADGLLVLATGNKSELAVGYSTLYGDMCGAVSVIGDVIKTRVYALARWINEQHALLGYANPPIPQRSIDRPASAELRPDQQDEESLMPYRELDQIIVELIEQERSVDEIAARSGVERATVLRFVQMIDRAQFKRDQAAVILKMTPRTFGRGRPMPIVMKTESGERTMEFAAADDADRSQPMAQQGGRAALDEGNAHMLSSAAQPRSPGGESE